MRDQLINYVRRLVGYQHMRIFVREQLEENTTKILFENRCNLLKEHILQDTGSGITSDKFTDHNIIVSLTSFGRRLQDVAFAIESIMQQTVKPNRIILWLSHEDCKRIPQALRLQEKRGLEIEACDDILSYKKIIPALKRYQQDAIITIDDDTLYDFDVLERLIEAYLAAPQQIHGCRAHRITFDEKGQVQPYRQWKWTVSKPGADLLNFVTGCGGILYPPDSLDEEVLNESVFMDICKYADDVWLNAMAIKKGTLRNKIETRNMQGEDYLTNYAVQDSALNNINFNGDTLNDIQIQKVFSKYSILDKIRQ